MKKKVTYYFYPGRIEKLKNPMNYSKEFFYSYDKLLDIKNFDTEFFEITNKNNFLSNFGKIFDKIVYKISKLQSDSSKFYSFNVLKSFTTSSIMIFTNYGLGLSAVPFLFILNFFNKKKVIVINSGLFSLKECNSIQKNIQQLFLKIFINKITFIVFTSRTEFEYALNIFPDKKLKFRWIEFGPEFEFWSSNKQNNIKKDGILVIGNDAGRNYELTLQIVEKLPKIKFTIVTQNELVSKYNFKNLELISGKWSDSSLTDLDILKLYNKAKLTIVPLHDTLVASGQSVTLQSMSAFTPVLISKTIGFWNKSIFKNNREIFFADKNTLEDWLDKIEAIYHNSHLLEYVSNNGFNIVKNTLNKKNFDKKFIYLIESLL